MSAVDQAGHVGDPPPPPQAAAPAPLGRNRDFLLLWSGAGLTLLGARVSGIAYPLLVLWYTRSATAAGLVGFAAQLPNLLVQLPAGVFVDRWDRRRLMILCDIGCALATATVAVAVFFDRVWLPHLMAVAFVEGSLAIFYRLAERAGVRHLVHPDHLPAALTRNEARGQAAGLLGQPVGSMLFAFTRWVPFLFTSIAHLASLLTLLLIRREFQRERAASRRGLRAEVAEGMSWTWRQKFLRTVMGFVAASNILFQGLSLALILIVFQRGGSVAVVGVITMAAGVGGVFGALSGAWWMRRLSLRAIVIGGLAAWAVLMPVVAVVRDPFALGALFASMSYVGGVFNVTGGVYQVRITPDHLQGRVNSVLTLIGSGTNALGALCAGFLLDAFGTTRTVLGIGAAMAVLAGTALLSRTVRNERSGAAAAEPVNIAAL